MDGVKIYSHGLADPRLLSLGRLPTGVIVTACLEPVTIAIMVLGLMRYDPSHCILLPRRHLSVAACREEHANCGRRWEGETDEDGKEKALWSRWRVTASLAVQ